MEHEMNDNNATNSTKPARQIEAWEKLTLERMLYASLKEQRRARRWGIFFKLAFLLYLLLFIIVLWPSSSSAHHRSQPHAAAIDIQGSIMPGTRTNARNIIKSLRAAFKDKGTLGIILRINSPGGSPVQSAYVYDEIKRLRKKYPDIQVYAVCSDICASGAYYIAAAADKIYANESSLVGSIGVLLNGFGFVGTMQKLGVERRLITAGDNKGMMDPFSPVTEEQQTHIKNMLKTVHEQFIEAVKQGRGDSLKKNDANIFSGLVWTGVGAKRLGLIDGFMNADEVARKLLKTEKIINYTSQQDFLSRFTDKFSSKMANAMVSKLQNVNSELR